MRQKQGHGLSLEGKVGRWMGSERGRIFPHSKREFTAWGWKVQRGRGAGTQSRCSHVGTLLCVWDAVSSRELMPTNPASLQALLGALA